MERLISVRFISTKLHISDRGEQCSFTMSIPPNIKRIRGILVATSMSDKNIRTTVRYFGKGVAGESSAAFISTLTREAVKSRFRVFTITSGPAEHVYYIIPKRLGKAEFSINGTSGGFKHPLTITLADPESGFIEEYLLYESLSGNLGTVKIEAS